MTDKPDRYYIIKEPGSIGIVRESTNYDGVHHQTMWIPRAKVNSIVYSLEGALRNKMHADNWNKIHGPKD